MPRDKEYLAIVLKKQAYGEADEIITFYTRETGKLRAKAVSSKLPASRLGPALQAFFLVNLRVAGSGLPKIIGATIQSVFRVLQEDPQLASLAFVAAEVVMRSTPDEQKNEELFDLLTELFNYLNKPNLPWPIARLALVKFKANALDTLGLGISRPEDLLGGDKILILKQTLFEKLDTLNISPDSIDSTLSEFLTYQLEREIRSDRFVAGSSDVV